MKTIMLGHDLIKAGSANVVVAGGLESMTNAPYLLPKARAAIAWATSRVLDHMFIDGLQDPYEGKMMGDFAEATADKYGFRATAGRVRDRVGHARPARRDEGIFADEIAPVTIKAAQGRRSWIRRRNAGTVNVDKIPTLRAFAKDGTVTAASSSSISDGAAARGLMTASEAERRGVEPLARITGHSSFAHAPAWFTTAPVFAIKALHEKLGWSRTTSISTRSTKLSPSSRWRRCTTSGSITTKSTSTAAPARSAIPIGATGARITTTLLHALAHAA